ncbi:MAG: hypothetical protein ACLFWM_14055 [Actinomycetota bacterium]
MQTTHPPVRRIDHFGRQAGYAAAAGLNMILLVVVLYLAAWDILPFLTGDFAEVVPWLAISLLAAAAANSVYVFNDHIPVRRIGEVVTSLATLAATYQLLAVFPFDFSAYTFDWALVTRIALIAGMVGAVAGLLVAFVKLVSWAATPDEQPYGSR